MNYRHIFHAGNFADIFKHFMGRLAVEHILKKDKGAFFLDAFAGVGLYDLKSSEAARSGESQTGIDKFMAATFANADLAAFQGALRSDYQLALYPGSCLQMARMLRPQDCLIANELHPDDAMDLRRLLCPKRQQAGEQVSTAKVSVSELDAYLAIRGALPPAQRRGMVLIDPPFEKKNEFELLIKELKACKKSWPTGCYMIWYPIKDIASVHEFYDEIKGLNFPDLLIAEVTLTEGGTGIQTLDAGVGNMGGRNIGLKSCGIMIVNMPYQLDERLSAARAELEQALGSHINLQFFAA